MGTMLYAKGVYINRCYDELNLSAPDLVREIHTEYIRAGADIIETNTFGATAHKLQQYGLEANLHEINALAARVAREAAGERAYVAGAIGPLGLRIEPYGPTSFAEARDLFKALRQNGEVLKTVQSQAGAHNHDYVVQRWWDDGTYADFGHWIHD